MEVILKAPKLADSIFSSNLVLDKYKNLIDGVNVNYIKNPLIEIYSICKKLDKSSIKTLKKAVINNNRIRELCKGEVEPVLYSEIEIIDNTLAQQIKYFCDNLYDESIKKAAFYNQFDSIDNYYNFLVGKSVTCRSCGRSTVLTKFNSHRSGLDHYLPRKHYPFSAINFKNLIPICDICNESYKNQKDPLIIVLNKGKSNEQKIKTKAYYPFSRFTLEIVIKLNFLKNYDSNICPEDMEVSFECVNHQEEVDNWDRLFGIEENYKAEFCSDEMYSYYEEVLMATSRGLDYLDLLKHQEKWADKRFLKIPFLTTLSA
ncbi:hypothetical protein [Zobellia uliginosa]|uniref:hypothetical protein n=1 Tax=Zobellia uliginosa TaxID=143224 RepID=UPI001C074395|nr:hypothetical protein [Zobellia uliginosa]MBU2946605.1 hypothetical protein [Zobellia uliginosa]